MVDQTVVSPARTGEWRVKWGMGQLHLLRAATRFVLLCVCATFATSFLATATPRFANTFVRRAGDAQAAPAGAAASAKRLSAVPHAAARKPQASEVQTYPERPTPS